MGMTFKHPPAFAAWQHREARDGFEVAFLTEDGGGYRVDGHTAAVEEGVAWAVEYSIRLDSDWTTRSAVVRGRSTAGRSEATLEGDGAGGWWVDGKRARELDGCLDVDLESSALTNTFPVHRLALEIGDDAQPPAAYVRAFDLRVERLEQRYTRIENADEGPRYQYQAPAFEFECELTFDDSGLVVTYPGLAARSI